MKQVKVTVEHEPGCVLVVIIGIMLAVIGNMGGCTINIGSEINTVPRQQMTTP